MNHAVLEVNSFGDLACVRSWGRPVKVRQRIVGYVLPCDRGWAATHPDGNLISVHPSERSALAAISFRSARR